MLIAACERKLKNMPPVWQCMVQHTKGIFLQEKSDVYQEGIKINIFGIWQTHTDISCGISFYSGLAVYLSFSPLHLLCCYSLLLQDQTSLAVFWVNFFHISLTWMNEQMLEMLVSQAAPNYPILQSFHLYSSSP